MAGNLISPQRSRKPTVLRTDVKKSTDRSRHILNCEFIDPKAAVAFGESICPQVETFLACYVEVHPEASVATLERVGRTYASCLIAEYLGCIHDLETAKAALENVLAWNVEVNIEHIVYYGVERSQRPEEEKYRKQ